MIRAILADNHPLVRSGIRALLETDPTIEVVGETGDVAHAIELALLTSASVIILDTQPTGQTLVQAVKQVVESAPNTNIVVLTSDSDEVTVLESLRSGALAFVLKDDSPHLLLDAIHAASVGRRYLSTLLAERAIEVYLRSGPSKHAVGDNTFTRRELEVLQLTAEGKSSSIVGEHLGISARTVETHRARMLKKLGVRNQAQLIRIALERGILSSGG